MTTRSVETKKTGTWLVTGANRGIGLAFARELLARGQNVVGTARKPEEANDLRAAGVRVERLDVADASSIDRLAAALRDEPIDVLIHNAGRGGGANAAAEITAKEIEAFFRVGTADERFPNEAHGIVVKHPAVFPLVGLDDEDGVFHGCLPVFLLQIARFALTPWYDPVLIKESIACVAEILTRRWTVGDEVEFRGGGRDVDCAPNDAAPHLGCVS